MKMKIMEDDLQSYIITIPSSLKAYTAELQRYIYCKSSDGKGELEAGARPQLRALSALIGPTPMRPVFLLP